MKRFPKADLLIDGALFAAAGFGLFWRLGSYPAWFDSIVGFALWPQVNHVLEGAPLEHVSWQWADMFQHNAGASPVYSAFEIAGLHAFGLTLFGVRFPLALVAWAALGGFYAALRTVASKSAARLTFLLVITAPWYLTLARCGGILSLSVSLGMLVFALLVWAHRVDRTERWRRSWLWAGLTLGVAVGLLPYGHTSTRLLALLLAIGIPFARQVFSFRVRLAFLAGLLAMLSLQLRDPVEAASVYFQARGENIWAIAKETTDGALASKLRFVGQQSFENIEGIVGLLMLNADGVLVANQADSFWSWDAALCPGWTVPFLLVGIGAAVWEIAHRRHAGSALLVAAFLASLAPGVLAGIGGANLARLQLAVLPFFGLTAHGVIVAWRWTAARLPGRACMLLGTASLAVVLSAQWYNFFALEKGVFDDRDRDRALHRQWQEMRALHPRAVLVLQEFSDFGIESYVTLRWLGAEPLAAELRAGTTFFARKSAADRIKAALGLGREAFLLSRNPDDAKDLRESCGFVLREERDGVTIYQWDGATQPE